MKLLIDTRLSPSRRFESKELYQCDRFIVEVTTTTKPGKVGLLQAIASVGGIDDVEVARLAVVGNQRQLFEVPAVGEIRFVFELSDWVPIQAAQLHIWGQPTAAIDAELAAITVTNCCHICRLAPIKWLGRKWQTRCTS